MPAATRSGRPGGATAADRPVAMPLPAATTAVVPIRANRARASVRPRPCRSLAKVREPIAHAEHRQQIAWIVRIRLDLAAQILDVRVDGALVGVERNPANRTQ